MEENVTRLFKEEYCVWAFQKAVITLSWEVQNMIIIYKQTLNNYIFNSSYHAQSHVNSFAQTH